MNERELRESIHRAVDKRLSGVISERDYEKDIFSQMTVRNSRIKPKGLLIAVLLLAILLSFSALAAVLIWKDYVGQVIQKEQQTGQFAQWEIEEKVAFIEALCNMGYISADDKNTTLLREHITEEEKHKFADEIVLSFLEQSPYIQQYETSFNHHIDSVTSTLLTFAIMGPTETWSAEERAWWQKLTDPYVSSSNDMVWVNPEQHEIKETDAIQIAKSALLTIMHIPKEELAHAQAIANMYVTEERPNYRRWLVTFNVFADGSNQYIERSYEVFIDGQGNLIADADYDSELLEARAARLDAEQEDAAPQQILDIYKEYADFEGSYLIREWSLEAKAEYSAIIQNEFPDVHSGNMGLSRNMLNMVKHREIAASIQHVYGLPEQEDIQLDDALDLARDHVYSKYGLDEETNADRYTYYEYYDITNPDQPLWKFIFFPDSFEGYAKVPVYEVIFHARSGEAIVTERYDWQSMYINMPYHHVWY